MSTEPDQSSVNPSPAAAPPPASGTTPGSDKKMVSGILAILLGALGIHKFYLGYKKEGIIMLVVSVVGSPLCGIPPMIVGIVGLVEGILYLTKTDEEFVATYITGKKSWF
jgi:TM2 domain-containing membrane protein YozV